LTAVKTISELLPTRGSRKDACHAMPCLPDGLLGSPLGLWRATATRCGAGSRPAPHVYDVTRLWFMLWFLAPR
jgi:hypothetical protein